MSGGDVLLELFGSADGCSLSSNMKFVVLSDRRSTRFLLRSYVDTGIELRFGLEIERSVEMSTTEQALVGRVAIVVG